MGRKTIDRQVCYALSEKMKIGESRHQAKNELKGKMGKKYRFGMTTEGIHSYETRSTYQKACLRFARWCIEENGVNRYTKLENIKELVTPYMQHRLESGMSIFTLKTERAALGKLYGESVNFALPQRTPDKITRSRGFVEMDKHFSATKNKDLIIVALGTGSRRNDLANMCVSHFQEVGGHLYVDIFKSKGGRDRIAPVLPGMEKKIRNIVNTAREAGREQIFERIHTKMDVHSYRREYAQKLYEAVSIAPKLRDELRRVYPPRREKIKSDIYSTQRKDIKNKIFMRDNVYIVTQALGHNRLDVTVNHYLI